MESKLKLGVLSIIMLALCACTVPTNSSSEDKHSSSIEEPLSSETESSQSSNETSSTGGSSSNSSSSSSSSENPSSSSSSEPSSSSSSESSSSSSSSTNNNDFNGYYAAITDNMSGTTLLSALKTIITKNISVSYDWSRYEDADEAMDDPTCITTIYSRENLKKTAHVGSSQSPGQWNREHTFPQSKLDGNSKSDNHIIFASDYKVNGTRSNKILGMVEHTSNNQVKDAYGNLTQCYTTSSLFEPVDIAKGETARATMYASVLYDLSITENISSVQLCLEWNISYAPGIEDAKRNDAVFKNQKNRNPFTDHPEYACRIWGNTNSATKTVCGIN